MKSLLFFLTTCLILFSCNNAQHKNHEDHSGHQHDTIISESHSEPHHETNNPVQLDNGKKWKANIETTQGIANMKKIVTDAIAAKPDQEKLIASLQKEFQTIFDKCTMTGEAHEQLHNYLIPVKKQLDELKSTGGSIEVLKSLKTYLDSYSRYFE